MTKKLSEEFSGPMLPFIALCVALNLTVGQITAALKLPVYLDSVGTVLLAVLSGPVSAIVAGSFANLLASAMGNPPMMFFIPVVIVIGGFASLVARLGAFKVWYFVLAGGICQGILGAIVSAPISAYVFGGVTMGAADFMVMLFRSSGFSLFESTLRQGLIMDPIDKTITFLVVYALIKNLPDRLLYRFPGVSNIKPAKSNLDRNLDAS